MLSLLPDCDAFSFNLFDAFFAISLINVVMVVVNLKIFLFKFKLEYQLQLLLAQSNIRTADTALKHYKFSLIGCAQNLHF